MAKLTYIGQYRQITDFTTNHAGTSEWCKAERDGTFYFIKKLQSPVYPSKEIGLPEKKYESRVNRFHETVKALDTMYHKLSLTDTSGILVIPSEIINYQYHICTVAEFVTGNIKAEQVCQLSEWQRIILLRTLTLALINVHSAGIVHSDMKPDNVIIVQDAQGHCTLRLIDFDGSFYESEPPRDPEDIHGDPAYFAPEVCRRFRGEDIRLDHRLDIFALGLIFHYFWCGRLPDKPSDKTIAEHILDADSIGLDESIPPVIGRLIAKMLRADPEERISCREVYDALGAQVRSYPALEVKLISDQSAAVSEELAKRETVSGSDAEKKEADAKAARRKAVSDSDTEEMDAEADECPFARKPIRIRIFYCDENGRTLDHGRVNVEPGTEKKVVAEYFEGYQVIGASRVRISVDDYGNAFIEDVVLPDATVRFFYRRKKRGVTLALGIAAAVILAWMLMCQLSMDAYRREDWERARQLMVLTPLFSTMFSEQYEQTLQNAQAVGLTEIRTGDLNTPSPKPTKIPTPKPTMAPTPRPTITLRPRPTNMLTSAPASNAALRDANVTVGSYVTFGTYPQTSAGNDNTPIEWLVLARDGDTALLISRYGLNAKPYNDTYKRVTWETCSLREWLNGPFLNSTFTEGERNAILLTYVDNSQSQNYNGYGTEGGSDTWDWVFLLSYKEAWTYFGNDEARTCALTGYAVTRGAYRNTYSDGWWWLRSPGFSQSRAASVNSVGSRDSGNVDYGYGCIRPALWVNLDSGFNRG